MLEFLLVFGIMLAMVMLTIGLICIPIIIANAHGISGGEKIAIIILSCMGIIFGITWFVALILSLVWTGDKSGLIDNMDKLERLAKLYKDKVITKAEYEAAKAKLI